MCQLTSLLTEHFDFLTYLKTVKHKHSVQTCFHRGSDALDLKELDTFLREEGECQILHDFA